MARKFDCYGVGINFNTDHLQGGLLVSPTKPHDHTTESVIGTMTDQQKVGYTVAKMLYRAAMENPNEVGDAFMDQHDTILEKIEEEVRKDLVLSSDVKIGLRKDFQIVLMVSKESLQPETKELVGV